MRYDSNANPRPSGSRYNEYKYSSGKCVPVVVVVVVVTKAAC